MPTPRTARPDFRRRVGARIRGHRTIRGLSQGDLARRMGGDVYTVSRWERGQSFPTYKHICALAKALDVTEEQLLTDDV